MPESRMWPRNSMTVEAAAVPGFTNMSLTFVPTPLGNLRDITLRGIDALRAAETIVAEDSRVTRKLLSALDIHGIALLTFHEHSGSAAAQAIVERAVRERVVVVTDAGMPGVSDPGRELVVLARAAGVPIEVLPGPVAYVAAAVLSGLAAETVVFEGFLPRERAKRRARFAAARDREALTVWYESPHRLIAALGDLDAVAPGGAAFVLREYTKMHEQQIAGTPAAIRAALAVPVRGECTLCMRGAAPAPAPADPAALDVQIDALLDEGLSISAIAKRLADEGFGQRRHLYARAVARKDAAGEDAPAGR